MTTFDVQTDIAAAPEVCFDLARDVAFHARSLAHTRERIVHAPDRALLELGDEVEFEGRHLGVRQRLRARITAFDRPRGFRDEMTRGAFRSFAHDHRFEPTRTGTRMTDRVRFRAPFGPIGRLVARFVLRPYLQRLIAGRADALRREAERRAQAGVGVWRACE